MKRTLILSLLAVAMSTCLAQTQKVKVVEYHQAPGQFVNVLPAADEETTQEEVCAAATRQLEMELLLSLGSYGGYVTMQLDHAIMNKPGSDFIVHGNGFYAAEDPVYGEKTIGGSIEPGIVYVGVGNDLSSAKWYELAGSEYFTSEIHDFTITYTKPTSETVRNNYIPWTCSWTDRNGAKRDSTGYVPKNTYHLQSYWPLYEGKDKLTFSGGKLPNNAVEQSGDGTYWVQYRYSADSYGYVDACPTKDSLYSSFDIDWAVDEKGRPVALDSINYVRVVSSLLQVCGWLGETSTEVAGLTDLHLLPGYDDNPYRITPRPNPNEPSGINRLKADVRVEGNGVYYNLAGQRVSTLRRGQIYIHNGKKIVY